MVQVVWLSSVSDHHANVEVEIGSERGFGYVFTAVFVIVAVWPLWGGGSPRWILLAIAAVILGLAVFLPSSLRVPNRLWFKFGMLLGAIVAPIVMFLVFLTTFVPFGLVMRLIGKDLLSTKIDKEKESYWVERTEQPGSMRQQF